MSEREPARRPNPGMSVLASDHVEVGSVKEVRTNDFLLDRALRRDVYVPFSAIESTTTHSVLLALTAEQIDEQDWDKPPFVGGEDEADSLAPREDRVVGTGDPADRGAWSPSSDAYSLEPLDTTEQRLATEGIDDGMAPRGAEPPTAEQVTRRLPRTDDEPAG